MSKYLFKTVCPVCGDSEIISWRHATKTCGGAQYIDEDLYLHCDKCNDKIFLFNMLFQCGKHDYQHPNCIHHVFKALLILNESSDVPYTNFIKMIDKVRTRID